MALPEDGQSPGVPSAEAVQALNDMIMGFRLTQMIHVAAKLDIAGLLRDGPQTANELAGATGTHAPSLYRLMRALAGMGIFAEDDQGRFAITPLAEPLLAGVPGSQRPAALYFGEESTWRTWGEFLYSVTTGEPAFNHLYGMDPWEYRARNPEMSSNFDDFMTSQTTLRTAAIVAAYDFSQFGTIVDVAGGHGTLIAAILQAYPALRGILCDAPHVVSGAGPVLEAAGISDRCEAVPCDFFSSVPAGGDAYILKSIIHDWDDERAVEILKTCRRAIPDHGRLLLVENIIPAGNAPHPGKLTDLQMLVALGGRERTEAEYGRLLSEAGFRLIHTTPTTVNFSIVEGAPV